MMKRKTYRITSTAGHDETRYAWNSARRAMVDCMHAHAHNVGGYWECSPTAIATVKQGNAHVRGQFGWTGPNGQTVVFTITREDAQL
jgi:hypothetical protein